MATMTTCHPHRRRLLWSSLPSSWGARGQWRKLCASSRKTLLVATHINQGPSQISTVHSRSFWIRSLQSSRWLRNHCRLRVTEHLKAEYASHQLQGPAGIWWTHFLSSLPANVRVTWEQFKLAFRGHHIPPGPDAHESGRIYEAHSRNKVTHRIYARIQQLVQICSKFHGY